MCDEATVELRYNWLGYNVFSDIAYRSVRALWCVTVLDGIVFKRTSDITNWIFYRPSKDVIIYFFLKRRTVFQIGNRFLRQKLWKDSNRVYNKTCQTVNSHLKTKTDVENHLPCELNEMNRVAQIVTVVIFNDRLLLNSDDRTRLPLIANELASNCKTPKLVQHHL